MKGRKVDTMAGSRGSLMNRLMRRRQAVEAGNPMAAREPMVKKPKLRDRQIAEEGMARRRNGY